MLALILLLAAAGAQTDREVVAEIREEGFHRSELPETLSYMTDVLGGRLTNSLAMDRAQDWAMSEMERIGLDAIVREPFMDYGASWDNEFFSLHMTAPGYQTLVGYPIAHTPGTEGRVSLDAVIADVRLREDLEPLRGRLRGKAVLSTPPAAVDRAVFATGRPERSDEEMRRIERDVLPARPRTRPSPDPRLLTPVERLRFFVEEGAAAVLESRSGWPGAVRASPVRGPRWIAGTERPHSPRFPSWR